MCNNSFSWCVKCRKNAYYFSLFLNLGISLFFGFTGLAALTDMASHWLTDQHLLQWRCAGGQVGKVKKTKDDRPTDEGVGMNVKSIVVVALMMILMLFAVHCTWVTSNAYSSPSIVLASYGHDGYVMWLVRTSMPPVEIALPLENLPLPQLTYEK